MDEDVITSSQQPADRSDRRRIVLAAVGGGLSVILLGAGALAVSGMASASTNSLTATTTSTSPGEGTPAGNGANHPPMAGPGMFGGLGGLGGIADLGRFGLGDGDGILYGSAVVKTKDGTYQTYAAQRGTATVGASSITVKSADNHTQTYAVDKNTVVNKPGGKLSDIKTGANVVVIATVDGSKYTATRIIDLGALQSMLNKLKGTWQHKLGSQWGHLFPHGQSSPTPKPSSSHAGSTA